MFLPVMVLAAAVSQPGAPDLAPENPLCRAGHPALEAAARIHRERGLRNVTGEHYEGAHWLGTFTVYLVSGRGLGPSPAL
jgi:hypothetical protein